MREDLLLYVGHCFLTGRSFQVRVGTTLSRVFRVLSGVPQGSVLGPLLFIGYLRDLYEGLKTKYASFADDTNVYCNPLLQHNKLQEGLITVKQWTQNWRMPLNDCIFAKKTR